MQLPERPKRNQKVFWNFEFSVTTFITDKSAKDRSRDKRKKSEKKRSDKSKKREKKEAQPSNPV